MYCCTPTWPPHQTPKQEITSLQPLYSLNTRRYEDENSSKKEWLCKIGNCDADPLASAICNSTQLLQKLLFKPNTDNERDTQSRDSSDLCQRRQQLVTCWQCGEQGYIQRSCLNHEFPTTMWPVKTSGNDQRLAPGAQCQL